ncbi:MAG: 3-keto-5-aminohexanoate cleavage protein [Pseudomonadota bacterium]
MRKPLLMVAPNGARRGKAEHSLLPITIAETVEAAKQCYGAGAGALHLHVRDQDGGHSLDAGLYREALSELARKVPDMRVQITTEAAGIYGVSDQLNCLKRAAPSWASIAIREIAREPGLADAVYGTCRDNGTKVQHILFDAEDARFLEDWLDAGIVRDDQRSVLLVLGRYTAGQISDPAGLPPVLNALPRVSEWMLCAFGRREHECLIAAARLGGDCRVGFENSLENSDGHIWANNAQSVATLSAELESATAPVLSEG